MIPALKELLPKSGIPGDAANTGYYGGLLFLAIPVGWVAHLFGPYRRSIRDASGRLILTILCYSLFHLLGAIAQNVWHLAFFRFSRRIGIGGEWTLGGILVAEVFPEARRKQAASYMHTGYYVGTLMRLC